MTSQLFEKDALPFWKSLLELLTKVVDLKTVVILYSLEHLLETSHRDYGRAQWHDAEFFKLSKGFTLDSEGISAPKLLIKAIRNYPITASTYFHRRNLNTFSERKEYDLLKEKKEIFNKMSAETGSIINPIREATAHTGRFNLKAQKRLANATGDTYKMELISRFKKFHRYGFTDARTIDFKILEIPFWADAIIDDLINNYNLNSKEAKRGWELLEKKPLRLILPTLYVRTSLESMMSTRHKKETHNDHMDILRMTTAIPFADIVFTDKSMASAVIDLGLDKEFKTNILTGSESDLKQFENLLGNMLQVK